MIGILSFLTVVSGIIFVVALIILLIRLVKKKSKKPFVIMACSSAIVFLVLCVSISNIYIPTENTVPVVAELDESEQPVKKDNPVSEAPEKIVTESKHPKLTNDSAESVEETTPPSDIPSIPDEKTKQNTESKADEKPKQNPKSKTDKKQDTKSKPEQEPEPSLSHSQEISQALTDIVEQNYASTEVSDITINENLGTDAADDYVALVTLTWSVKNGPDLTKKMLAMYSEDYAARIASDISEISELCIFWIVPYYSDTDTIAKYAYERRKKGMYEADVMISELLD